MQETGGVHQSMPRTVTATSAGHVAIEALSTLHDATVLGVTSRGVFLRLGIRNIIFLTTEPYRSPLTIILPQRAELLDAVTTEDLVLVHDGHISFPNAGIRIDVPSSSRWICSLPAGQPLSPAERRQNLHRLASTIALTAPDRGWSRLLPPLLDPVATHGIPSHLRSTWERVKQLRSAMSIDDAGAIISAAGCCLGRGRGLTPSGDDFMLGVTLMLNRWPAVTMDEDTRNQYNHHVVEAAYTHTTALSANLIECASFGTSDERLVRTADYLITGTTLSATAVSDVLQWGSSSGIDALVGMTVALTAGTETASTTPAKEQ